MAQTVQQLVAQVRAAEARPAIGASNGCSTSGLTQKVAAWERCLQALAAQQKMALAAASAQDRARTVGGRLAVETSEHENRPNSSGADAGACQTTVIRLQAHLLIPT